MRKFFRPLRRKIGVVTLAVACVLMQHWLEVMDHIAMRDEAFDDLQLSAAGLSTVTLTLLSAWLLLSKARPVMKSKLSLPPEADHA